MKSKRLDERVIAAIIGINTISHIATFGAGAYKGFIDGNNYQTQIPIQYFLIPEIAIAAASVPIINKKRDIVANNIILGATAGTILAIGEFYAGYAIGYVNAKTSSI